MASQSEKARDLTENGDTNGQAPVQDTARSELSSKSMATELMALIATYEETKDRKFLEQAKGLIRRNDKAAFCGNRMLYKLACGDEGLTEEESEGAYEEFCVMVPNARKWPLQPAHLQFVAQGLREAGLTLVPQQIRHFMAVVAIRTDSGEYGTVGAGDFARHITDELDCIFGSVASMEPLLNDRLKVQLKLVEVKLTDIVESSRAYTAALKRSLDDDKLPQETVAIMSTYGEIADVDSAKLLATRMYNDTAGEIFKIQERAEEKLEALIEVLQAFNKD
ncbi:hypothetical protein SLS55_008361 [Diplodia seriata]|uniref:Uncharacterized protein n=1 Tax=Diplodia seriata TaxID=420778 RepID=A0ABR3CA84_9PEZI